MYDRNSLLVRPQLASGVISMGSVCVSCGGFRVGFDWKSLLNNGSSVVEVNLSPYCLDCGLRRLRVLRRTLKATGALPELLPEERC